ncbi:MAG: hypothetical protein JWO38_7341, partial [Gemmataceae bacterium]|nr:hypothetical protein [Gemmataceae bacterium]
PPRPPAPPREQICGGSSDPEFRDPAPAGGFLVGLDVGFHTFVNYDTVCTVRPIFGVGDQYTSGQLHGTDTRRVTRVLAKPGYAVGGLSVKAGLGLDGFFVTFMKVVGDRLDPTDSYTSEWLGGPGGNGPTKLGGDGTPVVGIIGKKTKTDLTGIGLMFGTQAGR